MRSFKDIYAIAAERKGGSEALEALLRDPLSPDQLRGITDDRWLAQMTKSIFQAGFNWSVVSNMWPGFEEAFQGFDPGHCVMLHDEALEALGRDKRIIRNGPKIRTVPENAKLCLALAKESGSVGNFFADWPMTREIELLERLKKEGSRLGGATGQRFLRFMGVDAFVLSGDVVARLIAEGVVDKQPSSKRDLKAAQEAFNSWATESGRSMTSISQTLAFSVGT